MEAIEVDSCGFRNHSFRFGGATAAENLNGPYRLLKAHGRWKSDLAKDGCIRDEVVSRLFVPMNMEI